MQTYPSQLANVADLQAHPRNYRDHPEEQLAQLEQSIREHGIYRNIVLAKDLTILAGHGVVEACTRLGVEQVPVIVLDLEPEDPQALKILAADNYLSYSADDDDHQLVALLEEIRDDGVEGLLGTGFTDQSLSAFKMVIRPPDAIHKENTQEEWEAAGLPAYEQGSNFITLSLHFDSEAERETFAEEIGLGEGLRKGSRVWTSKWPPRAHKDLRSVLVDG